MNQKFKNALRLFLPLTLGGIISFLIRDKMDFSHVAQPPLSPPGIVFPIVWTILYLMIGFSYYLYRKKATDNVTTLLYYLQLSVNLIWPILFFNFRLFFFSIVWIILLIVLVILYFKELYVGNHKISAYLLIPYILWLFLATYLNIGIYLLN